jgi:uncharacterized protein
MREAPAAVNGASSPTLCLRRPVVLATVAVLALVVGTAHSRPLTQQAQTDQGQKTLTAAELNALQQKAEQGDSETQFNLGGRYAVGNGVPQDMPEAVRWFRKAALQGHAAAQFMLGIAYMGGMGIPQNPAQALLWIRKSAEQGNASGQSALGTMYERGNGVTQDYAQAAAWYRKAAEQGEAMAQFLLGLRCQDGRGVPQDSIEGLKWMSLAAGRASGRIQEDAAGARDRLAQTMTPAQVAEAQMRARQWTEAFENRKK